SPTWIACEIQNGCQAFLCSSSTHFGGHGGEHVMNQRRIPRRSQSDCCGERGAFRASVTVQALFMEHYRNAEPCIFFDPLLNGVRQLRHFLRVWTSTRIFARPRDLAESILQRDFRAVRQEHALLVDKIWLRRNHEARVLPSTVDLS